jgi:hypothetical protein
MQKLYKNSDTSTLAMNCEPNEDDESTQVVVFELVVPKAAKVPALRQQIPTASLLMRPASVTSTVPGRIFIQLRANNTALGAAWCTTVTLPVPQPTQQARA